MCVMVVIALENSLSTMIMTSCRQATASLACLAYKYELSKPYIMARSDASHQYACLSVLETSQLCRDVASHSRITLSHICRSLFEATKHCLLGRNVRFIVVLPIVQGAADGAKAGMRSALTGVRLMLWPGSTDISKILFEPSQDFHRPPVPSPPSILRSLLRVISPLLCCAHLTGGSQLTLRPCPMPGCASHLLSSSKFSTRSGTSAGRSGTIIVQRKGNPLLTHPSLVVPTSLEALLRSQCVREKPQEGQRLGCHKALQASELQA